MSTPPALSRGEGLRGLVPLRGRRAARLLPRARIGGPMPWMVAVMTALILMAAAGALALGKLTAGARGDLAGQATVQIVEPDPARRAQAARSALAWLEARPEVAAAKAVPEAEIAALVEPWLGDLAQGEGALPLPALIDVTLAPGTDGGGAEALDSALKAAVPGSRLDAQSDWLAPVLRTLDTLRWVAWVLIALLALVGVAAVVMAARGALAANRATIEVVHHLGGTDRQVAGIFQRSILLGAGAGAAIGAAGGAAGVALVGARFGALDAALSRGGALDAADWAVLAAIPLFAVAIAVYTARMTVLANLRAML